MTEIEDLQAIFDDIIAQGEKRNSEMQRLADQLEDLAKKLGVYDESNA